MCKTDCLRANSCTVDYTYGDGWSILSIRCIHFICIYRPTVLEIWQHNQQLKHDQQNTAKKNILEKRSFLSFIQEFPLPLDVMYLMVSQIPAIISAASSFASFLIIPLSTSPPQLPYLFYHNPLAFILLSNF